MSEPALHTPDVQDPQNKLHVSEQIQHMPDVQENKRPMSEQAPHTSAKRHCVKISVSPKVLCWKGCPMQIGFFALAQRKSVNTPIVLTYSLVSSSLAADKINAISLHNNLKDLAKAYDAAFGEELAYYPTLFERRPDWLITMWSAANVRVTGLQVDENSGQAGDKYDQY